MEKNNSNYDSFYPLSPMQKGILFEALFNPKPKIAIELLSWEINGKVDLNAFELAWQYIVDRYTIFRTGFVWEGLPDPLQYVRTNINVPITIHDWRDYHDYEKTSKLRQFIEEERERGFNLSKLPLMRINLIVLKDDICQFVWTYHHILLDGWSEARVLRDMIDVYTSIINGNEISLKQTRPYIDYISWLEKKDIKESEPFWRDMMKGYNVPDSTFLKNNNPQSEHKNEYYSCKLKDEETEQLNFYVKSNGLTVNTIIQAAWALLLSSYYGVTDIVFGCVVSGRPVDLNGYEDMVGLFVNVLPVRVNVTTNNDLLIWLKNIQNQFAKARTYEYVPLTNILNWNSVSRSQQLFETIIAFQNYAKLDRKHGQGGLNIKNVESFDKTNYLLNLVVHSNEELVLRIEYDENRIDNVLVENMVLNLKEIITSLTSGFINKINQISMVNRFDKSKILMGWNHNSNINHTYLNLHELFEIKSRETPEKIAAICGDMNIAYGELNFEANQIARYLLKVGFAPNSNVGIYLNNSLEALVCMLGVLKAGGAYVPFDISYPLERIYYMLSDSKVTVLLTLSNLAEKIEANNLRVVCLDDEKELINKESGLDLDLAVMNNSLAYVIYTSGTTNKPKGVMVEHKSVVSYVESAIEVYGFSSDDRMLQFASLSFDASVEEIYPALACGATLVLRDELMLSSVNNFLRRCSDLELTLISLPTAFWHQIVSELNVDNYIYLSKIKAVIIGGETALPEYVNKWNSFYSSSTTLINTYGLTEATVVSTFSNVSDSKELSPKVPIGRPMPNTKVYILNPFLQPSPVGGIGELYIGGAGVARGYFGKPKLTSEKFISDIFASEFGERLYRTGDLARYLPDGNIEYFGRNDSQVKLRGFRIEVREIEAVLRKHYKVKNAVVLLQQDKFIGDYLVAYIESDYDLAKYEIQKYLLNLLPKFMIPSLFVILKAFPLNENGKTDRNYLKSLKRLERKEDSVIQNANTNATTLKVLSEIWKGVLGLETVEDSDNFFDLGGHSLLVMKVAARVSEVFKINITFQNFLDLPVLLKQAEFIDLLQVAYMTQINDFNINDEYEEGEL